MLVTQDIANQRDDLRSRRLTPTYVILGFATYVALTNEMTPLIVDSHDTPPRRATYTMITGGKVAGLLIVVDPSLDHYCRVVPLPYECAMILKS